MRWLVFLLLLANLLVFAYGEGYFGNAQHPDALRLQKQVRPDDIRLVSRDVSPPDNPAAKPAIAAPPASPAPAEVPRETVTTAPAEACLHWDNLTTREADLLVTLLSEKFADFKQSRQSKPATGASWWVFIPPLPSKADTDKKAGELKQLGVKDFVVIQDSVPDRFAISLGLFSTEAAGKTRLAELREKGVRSARLEQNARKETVALEARGPHARLQAITEAITAIPLSKSKTQDCP